MAGTGAAVPSDAIADLKENAKTLDEFISSDIEFVVGRTTPSHPIGKNIRTLTGINAVFDAAQAGQFVADSEAAVDRAETAAGVAMTAGWVYADVASGEAARTNGDYFWVVSDDNAEVLELWLMGATTTADTGKRTVSKDYIESVIGMLSSLSEETNEKVEHESLDYLYSLIDKNGNIVATIGDDGNIQVTGIDESIQESINGIAKKIFTGEVTGSIAALLDNNENIIARINNDASLGFFGGSIGGGEDPYQGGINLAVVDKDNNLVAYFDDDAELYLVGMALSVQQTISGLSPSDESSGNTALAASRGDKFILSDLSMRVISNTSLQASYKLAPYPTPLLPHDYTVPLTFIDTLSLTQPAQRVVIDTPYFNDDAVVHPALIEFYNGFRGYRYWMAITPYKNSDSQYENPFIYGSNDLVNFQLISGFDQPLAEKPVEQSGHNSDVGFTYDPKTGELICFWRKTIKEPSSVSSLWCRKTRDGRNWTDAEIIAPEVGYNTNAYLSPSYVFNPNDGKWHRFTGQDILHIKHATADSFNGPWTDQANITVPASFDHWHMDVRWVGDKMLMIINDYITTDNLYAAISPDGYNWTFNETPLLSGTFLPTYKATFLPEFDTNGDLSLKVAWTSSPKPADPNDDWRLFIANTNYISI